MCPAKSVRLALAQDLVRCAIGSLGSKSGPGGSIGAMATLGGGCMAALGVVSLANVIRHGVTGAISRCRVLSSDAAGGGGDQAGLGVMSTLGVEVR